MTKPNSYKAHNDNFGLKFFIHLSAFDCICSRFSTFWIIMILISFPFHIVTHSSWVKLKTQPAYQSLLTALGIMIRSQWWIASKT